MPVKKVFKINKLSAPGGAWALELSGPKVNGRLKIDRGKAEVRSEIPSAPVFTRIDAGDLAEAGYWALWDISQFDRLVDQEQSFHLGMCKQRNIVSDLEREIGRRMDAWRFTGRKL